MMNYVPLIRANIIAEFVQLLENHGAPVERILTATKLPILTFQDSELLFPLKQVFEFYERAARIEGCDYLGFLVGQQTQIEDLGAFGLLLHHSLTLHDAIQTAIHMIASYNSGDRIWLIEQGDQVWLCRKFVDELQLGRQYAEQHSIMIMIHLVQLAAGVNWQPTDIQLEARESKSLDEIEFLADITLHFEQDATAIVLPRSLLSLPICRSETCNLEQVRTAYQELHRSAPATTFPGSVRQVIASQLKENCPDIQLVADILGLSVRTLQRQLNEARLTYSQLVQQVRFDQAIQLVSDPSLKLNDISAELGYTDAANFTRAFRRWVGVTPSEFRHFTKPPQNSR
jgi:AraC-like DNA-binding protein